MGPIFHCVKWSQLCAWLFCTLLTVLYFIWCSHERWFYFIASFHSPDCVRQLVFPLVGESQSVHVSEYKYLPTMSNITFQLFFCGENQNWVFQRVLLRTFMYEKLWCSEIKISGKTWRHFTLLMVFWTLVGSWSWLGCWHPLVLVVSSVNATASPVFRVHIIEWR